MLPKQLSLTDGTIVKLCPTDKPLYCSKQGRFYSLHNAILTAEGWLLHEVKPSFSPRRRRGKWKSSNGISGSQYPTMRHFGNKHCHNLMALTWLGPRPQGMEIYIRHITVHAHYACMQARCRQ